MTRTEYIDWLIAKHEDEPDGAAERIRRDFFETLRYAGLIVPDDQDTRPVRTGFMCKVDFECELGGAKGGNHVYPSIGDLRENRKCVNGLSDIAEVEVQEVRVVQESDFEGGGCGITEVRVRQLRDATEEDVKVEEEARAEWEAKWGRKEDV